MLIHDQGDRDEIAMQLLRYRDSVGDGWANIVDMLTMYVEERRKVVRLLGEIGAQQGLSQLPPVRLPLAEPQPS